jgi:glycosyltransferase involved in cell wall biosynthesis
VQGPFDVLVVGPVPPPVDGRALATSWLVHALRNDGHAVTELDTHASIATKVRNCLRAAAQVLRKGRPDRVVVVASGDSGLAAESLPLLASRLRRVPTTLTYHSARNARENSWLLRLALAAGGPRLSHAVLDDAMGAELSKRYGIKSDRIIVVDNIGLQPLPAPLAPETKRSGVVHLSNLTVEKGLSAVLEVAERTGIAIRLIGGASAEATVLLNAARERGVPFEALGPRYGEAKVKELASARCFLFPSWYQHEAQPLVLYEAVAAGCVPIAWSAGWVGEQLERLGLGEYVFPVGDLDGITSAVEHLVDLDDDAFAVLSARTRAAFDAGHVRNAQQFRAVVR